MRGISSIIVYIIKQIADYRNIAFNKYQVIFGIMVMNVKKFNIKVVYSSMLINIYKIDNLIEIFLDKNFNGLVIF